MSYLSMKLLGMFEIFDVFLSSIWPIIPEMFHDNILIFIDVLILSNNEQQIKRLSSN